MLIGAYAATTAILCAFTATLVIPDANPTLFLFEKILTTEKLIKTFQGKKIWITGASSGIGAELANQLHGYGANLILSARREEDLKRVVERCRVVGSKSRSPESNVASSSIRIVPFDMTGDDEALFDAVDESLNAFGGIDILILNAGMGQLRPALDEDGVSTTRDLMELNFMGPVRLAMQVIEQNRWGKHDGKYFKRRGDQLDLAMNEKLRGHIVVTSSIAAKLPLPLGSSYAASKHAVQGYFTSMRSEYGEWLRVDLPCPGPIATAFHNRLNSLPIAPEEEDPEEVEGEAKMSAERCAQLIISSMAGPSSLMKETWIAKQPTLGFMYLNQHLPGVCNFLLGKIGPLRVKAWKAGLPLYKLSSWIKATTMD